MRQVQYRAVTDLSAWTPLGVPPWLCTVSPPPLPAAASGSNGCYQWSQDCVQTEWYPPHGSLMWHVLSYSSHFCSPTATKWSAEHPYAVLYDLHCDPTATANQPISAFEWPQNTIKGAPSHTSPPHTSPPTPHHPHLTTPHLTTPHLTTHTIVASLHAISRACSAVALSVCLLSWHWQWSVSSFQIRWNVECERNDCGLWRWWGGVCDVSTGAVCLRPSV